MNTDLTKLTDQELGRELIHARNRRDSHSFGSRKSEEHSGTVNKILREQERRRDERRRGSSDSPRQTGCGRRCPECLGENGEHVYNCSKFYDPRSSAASPDHSNARRQDS